MLRPKNKSCIFLDRDGVINIHRQNEYVTSLAEFSFKEGFFGCLRQISVNFDYIIIITNQSALTRGLLSFHELLKLNSVIVTEALKYSIEITDILYCPSKDDVCYNRKPNPGMIEYALNNYPDININNSIYIGDSERDFLLAKRIGLKYFNITGIDKFYLEEEIASFDNICEIADLLNEKHSL